MAYDEVLETHTPNEGRAIWNANDSELYSRPVGVLSAANPNGVWAWTNMPAALTEIFGLDHFRSRADLSGFSEARLVVRVATAGVAGAQLRLQYFTDAATWAYADGSTGPLVAIDAVGTAASTWQGLTAAAMADVHLRVVGIDGDGVADPAFSLIEAQVR